MQWWSFYLKKCNWPIFYWHYIRSFRLHLISHSPTPPFRCLQGSRWRQHMMSSCLGRLSAPHFYPTHRPLICTPLPSVPWDGTVTAAVNNSKRIERKTLMQGFKPQLVRARVWAIPPSGISGHLFHTSAPSGRGMVGIRPQAKCCHNLSGRVQLLADRTYAVYQITRWSCALAYLPESLRSVYSSPENSITVHQYVSVVNKSDVRGIR